ncbi:MAG: branched-chain amino acid ABC transporter permease [Desulfomonile tiedjei]|uniref:Branched-chain amino acid ABC transporter permease n=1 Tax=Desulfomonile tiedjei TaxID=2358 RepID=A0A9D6Z947_9BACT|nr:branched-chain amino acid ABC transporter permease [Desulfomonile tiedjei]
MGTLVLLGILGMVLPTGARSLTIQIMIFGIFAMGYDVCLGYTAQCSLGHSLFFGAGAYGCVLSMIHLKVGLLTALAISIGSGFVLGVLLGLICVRLSEAYFVIVTAIIAAVFHLLAMDLIWITGGDDGLCVSIPPLKLGFAEVSLYQPQANYYFVLFFMAVSYFVLARILNAPLGKIFLSIRENPKRAHFLGYNVTRYKLTAFVISGMFAALAGALYAVTLRYTSADYLSFYWCVLPVVWCLVGGLGTLVGPWVGVALMSLFQYYVSAWFTYYLLLFGVLVLIILRVSRKGIMGYVASRGVR